MSQNPEINRINCNNCIFQNARLGYNMLGHNFYSCQKGISFKNMKPDCNLFEPHTIASNTWFLQELYDNFIDDWKPQHELSNQHCWRIVDNTKKYKRISGNPHKWLAFKSEVQLDEFYNLYKDIINKSHLDNTHFNSPIDKQKPWIRIPQ